MIRKTVFVAKSALTGMLINILFAVPSYAFWDVGESFNFCGNSKDDVQAFSDFTKKRFSQRADIYDYVTVLDTAPDTIKALKFEWKIDNGHNISGTLPFNGDWEFVNHWYTYQYPRHKDYPIVLEPTVTPAVAKFTKTAEAHYPWFPTDIITNLLSSVASPGAEVGGMLASTGNRGKHTGQQGDKEYDPSDLAAYKDSETSDEIGDMNNIFHVYATLKKGEGNEFVYQYWAENFTDNEINGSWMLYKNESGEVMDELSVNVGAKLKKLLKEISLTMKPVELGGTVSIQINDQTFTFFAPAFAGSGEESRAGDSSTSSEAGLTTGDMSGEMEQTQSESDADTSLTPLEGDSTDTTQDEDSYMNSDDSLYEDSEEGYEEELEGDYEEEL